MMSSLQLWVIIKTSGVSTILAVVQVEGVAVEVESKPQLRVGAEGHRIGDEGTSDNLQQSKESLSSETTTR